MNKYELLKILDENNYIPSTNNLNILTENINCGSTILLSVKDVELTEGMDPDYLLMQILDKNGFTITENNVETLKSALSNGHVLLTD